MTGLRFDGTSEEYRQMLTALSPLKDRMVAAYKEQDFSSTGRYAAEIGSAYAPDDKRTAAIVAYLVRDIASAHFFGGINYQIDNEAEERERGLR